MEDVHVAHADMYVRVCMDVCMYVCVYVHANSICIHVFPSQIEIVYNKQKLLHGDFEITPPIRQGILMPKRTA